MTWQHSDRILASLKGLSTGDAVGKQTEGLSPDDILRWYPYGVRGFEGRPGSVIPRYADNRKRRWRVGETTDDTEQTIAVAQAILRDGAVSHVSVGRELLACKKSVHPGVKSFWEFHQAGDAARIAVQHDGCGAAIRVSPVGMLYRPQRLDDLVRGAEQSSMSTHGGPWALAAAAAVAAAVSAAIDDGEPEDIVTLALQAADQAEQNRSSAEPLFARAIRSVRQNLLAWPEIPAAAVARQYTPTDPLTIVPLAIALATVLDSAGAAILLAANVGGDSDSVASIAGAILGARSPGSVNEDWYEVVEDVNAHPLARLASDLARLRS